eukprot:GAFH01003535.1.p1 GENE.GAFH01003535.1~~GAFH01003535.1.p1  ORF type:complete len:309 (+),score=18.45 GAFH01003535.1:42-929(+)
MNPLNPPTPRGSLFDRFPTPAGQNQGYPPPYYPPPPPAPGMRRSPLDELSGTIGQIGSVVNTPFVQQYGQQLINESKSKFATLLSMDMLRYYFVVNNQYVINKLKLLVFPIGHADWKRRSPMRSRPDAEPIYLPPREDIHAPDLYIPLVSFITYILLVGVIAGSKHVFHPEILLVTGSTGLGVLVLEIFIDKILLAIVGSKTIPILDLIAYSTYKYVAVVLALLGNILLGRSAFYIITLIFGVFMCLFLFHTLSQELSTDEFSVGGRRLRGATTPCSQSEHCNFPLCFFLGVMNL